MLRSVPGTSKLIECVADELRSSQVRDQKIFATACDVSVADEVERLFSDISAHLGPVEILVNNAGVYGPKGESETVDFAEWARAIEINLYGTFLPCQLGIRHMKEMRRGKIINLSGGGATAPLPRISAYAASKAAVVRLTETLAEELREFSIDVNAIAPGALNTRLLEEVLSAGPDAVGKAFYREICEAARFRWRATREGGAFVRLPRIRDQRRNHGETHQRAMGSVGKPA